MTSSSMHCTKIRKFHRHEPTAYCPHGAHDFCWRSARALLWCTLLISLSILLTSNLFQQFDFGSSELKFVLDFGFGAVQLFGIILCVVITSQIFFNEIDQRTAISILSRDIARWEFLAGKLIGVAALLLVFCLVTGTLLSLSCHWRKLSFWKVGWIYAACRN